MSTTKKATPKAPRAIKTVISGLTPAERQRVDRAFAEAERVRKGIDERLTPTPR